MRSEIEQAILLLRRGDQPSLEKALALLQDTVFSFSMRVCGQREDAEDTIPVGQLCCTDRRSFNVVEEFTAALLKLFPAEGADALIALNNSRI